MTTINDKDLKIFAKKVTKLFWPNVIINDAYITPQYVIFCLKIAQAGVTGTSKIVFFETIWKSTFMGSINYFSDLLKMLTNAVKDSIDSYNKGQINELSKAGIVYKVGSQVKGYFQYGPEVVPCPDVTI